MPAELAEVVLFCISTGVIIWLVEARSSRLEEKLDRLAKAMDEIKGA